MSGTNQAELCGGAYLNAAGRAPSMATCKSDFPEGEASTNDRRADGIEGGRKRSNGNALRARARRAQARKRFQDTAGSIPTPHSLNKPRQVWRPRTPQNVRLLTPGASTNAPYHADDVQGEGCNMNVNQEMVGGGQSQAAALPPLAERFSPNPLQGTPFHTPFQPPAPDQHQLPAMHDHLPAVNAPPPNIIPYDVHGDVQYPPANIIPYDVHGDVQYPPGYLPYSLGNLPYPPGNLPYPPGYVLQYPVGIIQYPYVQYYTSPYW